jgi:predicted GIY-YIG superfamily endonuclease
MKLDWSSSQNPIYGLWWAMLQNFKRRDQLHKSGEMDSWCSRPRSFELAVVEEYERRKKMIVSAFGVESVVCLL